ncbi:MAG TPA: DUF3524 domain-containing protein [Anaerolineae bacterium]
MQIALVSPYHGGSHGAWAEGYQRHSQHDVTLLTLPDRFWKWRMHGGAVTLARRFMAAGQQPDLILATDMLDLTTFLALTRPCTSRTPAVLFMHENQLTYPLPANKTTGPMRRQLGQRDQHYAFVNYASMLAADLVLFNSQYHHDSFFAALPNFLKHFPEYNELGTVATLKAKSQVLPVGIDLKRLETRDRRSDDNPQSPISNLQSPICNPPSLILWNQRWEYDRNPAAFFQALYVLADEGIPFQLALCGQQYGKRPAVFDEANERLSDRIIHVGYAKESLYKELLWQAAVTVSTAYHEFFGISILEAITCHAFPILPHRLSYPELIPEQYHLRCLYQNQGGLVQRLRWALTHTEEAAQIAAELAVAVQQYDWTRLAPRYDAILARLTE